MNPFALGLAAATLASIAVSTAATTTTPPDGQPVPDQRAIGRAGPSHEAAQWPVAPADVVRLFEPHQPFGPGHRGVDLATVPGQSVSSALPGQISFSGDVAGRPVVVIEHAGGLRTTYLPVVPTVTVGTHVVAGEPIGSVAVGVHCPMSSCMHWGARLDGVYLDPLTLVEREVVLLPL